MAGRRLTRDGTVARPGSHGVLATGCVLPQTIAFIQAGVPGQPFRLGRLHPHHPAAALPGRALTRRGPGG